MTFSTRQDRSYCRNVKNFSVKSPPVTENLWHIAMGGSASSEKGKRKDPEIDEMSAEWSNDMN
jgi:hypothetical protein